MGRNDCGIAQAHAYSILAAFEMVNGAATIDMLLMRNPWGITYYTGTWSHNDTNWTDALVAKVPFSIDPSISHNKGFSLCQ